MPVSRTRLTSNGRSEHSLVSGYAFRANGHSTVSEMRFHRAFGPATFVA
jgi:hypothetical protein